MFGANATDIRATAQYKLSKAESWKTNDVLHPAQPINELSLIVSLSTDNAAKLKYHYLL